MTACCAAPWAKRLGPVVCTFAKGPEDAAATAVVGKVATAATAAAGAGGAAAAAAAAPPATTGAPDGSTCPHSLP